MAVYGRRRGAAVLACVLVVAMSLAGCGSGSPTTVSPTAYAKVLCDAVAPFERDIANRQSALDPTKMKTPTQGKAALQSFLATIAVDTSHAADRLKASGAPDVTHGAAIANAFAALFARLKTTLAAAATQARQLPTSSPTAFKTAATQLGTDVRTSMSNLGSGLSDMRSPQLIAAARKVGDCQSIG